MHNRAASVGMRQMGGSMLRLVAQPQPQPVPGLRDCDLALLCKGRVRRRVHIRTRQQTTCHVLDNVSTVINKPTHLTCTPECKQALLALALASGTARQHADCPAAYDSTICITSTKPHLAISTLLQARYQMISQRARDPITTLAIEAKTISTLCVQLV